MEGSEMRKTIGVVLAVVAVPLTFLSIFDPLEGGMALLATFALNRVIRVLTGVRTNRLYLRSFAVAVAVGGSALAIAISAGEGGRETPNAAMALAYVYSAVTLSVTAGAARYAWDLVSAWRVGRAPSR